MTTPQACIPAYTVVGPTKRKPAFFRRLESAVDSGVEACQSAWLAGTLWCSGAYDQKSSCSGSVSRRATVARAFAIVASILPR